VRRHASGTVVATSATALTARLPFPPGPMSTSSRPAAVNSDASAASARDRIDLEMAPTRPR
jgi:hypothetical protein